MGRIVLELHRERERKLSARIDISEKHICYCTSSLGSAIPSEHYRRHLLNPWHCNGISADDYNGKVRIHLCESRDELVLTVWKSILQSVTVFTVLMEGLVKSADIYHIIGVTGISYSLGNQFLLASVVNKVLERRYSVLSGSGVADITT